MEVLLLREEAVVQGELVRPQGEEGAENGQTTPTIMAVAAAVCMQDNGEVEAMYVIYF